MTDMNQDGNADYGESIYASAPTPNDPSPAPVPDFSGATFSQGNSNYQPYDSSVDSPGQTQSSGHGMARRAVADNRSAGDPNIGNDTKTDQQIVDVLAERQAAVETARSAVINPDLAEQNIPVHSFGRDARVPVDPANPESTATKREFVPSTTIGVNEEGQTGSFTIRIETDFSNLTTHVVDTATGRLTERRLDTDYMATAEITIDSPLLADGAASPEVQAAVKRDIELLVRNFKDKVEQLRTVGLHGEFLDEAREMRGTRMDRFASENKIGEREIAAIVVGLQADLEMLGENPGSLAEHIRISCEVRLPEEDSNPVRTIGKELLEDVAEEQLTDSVVIGPESDGSEPGTDSVAVINQDANPVPVGAGEVAGINFEEGPEQETAGSATSTPSSGTLSALENWANRYNQQVLRQGGGVDLIDTIEQIRPEGGRTAAARDSLDNAVNTLGRCEAFRITDVNVDESQWESVVVERNINGTFLRLERGDQHLEFRIGSRNMNQAELEQKLDTFMPLIGSEGAFDKHGHLQNSPLLVELSRLDGKGEGISVSSAQGITFDKVDLIAVNLDGARFTDCTFSGCVISGSMKGTVFDGCKVNKRSSITVTNGEGMVIKGKNSIWDSSVDFQGNVAVSEQERKEGKQGITIGGKRFACNTLAIKDWSGSTWHYDEAGGPMKLVKGIMIVSSGSNGVPTEIASKLVPLGRWKLGSWNARQAMSNREYYDRMTAEGTRGAFKVEDHGHENGKLTITFRSPTDPNIRVVWQGNDDRWRDIGQRMSWKNPASWIAEPINQLRKDFLGASILGSNLETDTLSSIKVEVRTSGDSEWREPDNYEMGDHNTIDTFKRIANIQLDPDASKKFIEGGKEKAANT